MRMKRLLFIGAVGSLSVVFSLFNWSCSKAPKIVEPVDRIGKGSVQATIVIGNVGSLRKTKVNPSGDVHLVNHCIMLSAKRRDNNLRYYPLKRTQSTNHHQILSRLGISFNTLETERGNA